MIQIAILTIFAILESVQVLVVTAYVYSFIPIHWHTPVPKGLEPERESFLYMVFLAAAFAFMVVGFIFLRPRLESEASRRRWVQFLIAESVWVFLLLFAFFKWITYRYPFYNVLPYENRAWVLPFFYVVLSLSLLSKIFWPEIQRFMEHVYPRWGSFALSAWQRRASYAGFAVLLVVLLLPDFDALRALGFWWDRFHHWDDFALSRWLLLHGAGYVQMLQALFVLTIAVWAVVFYAVERWLKSFWLAAFAVLLGLKINMFHYGMAPAGWLFPQATILGQGIDLTALQGLGNVPMYDALRAREFFSFFMGFALPVLYVFTVLASRNKIAHIVAVYGLVVYAGYIARPTLFAYGAMGLPAVLLLCFWIKTAAGRLSLSGRKALCAFLAAAALGALLTSRLFVTYPHAPAYFGQNFVREKQMFAQTLDLTQDAALMQQVIKPGKPAAVVGSFELALLHTAGRPAFFRHTPLFISMPFNVPDVPLRLKTKRALLDVLNQMDQTPPEYIFLQKNVNAAAALLSFVRDHYVPYAQGQYFDVWQRK